MAWVVTRSGCLQDVARCCRSQIPADPSKHWKLFQRLVDRSPQSIALHIDQMTYRSTGATQDANGTMSQRNFQRLSFPTWQLVI